MAKCEIGRVSPYRCSRVAKMTRVTNMDVEIKLCRVCDLHWGDIIGTLKGKAEHAQRT